MSRTPASPPTRLKSSKAASGLPTWGQVRT